MLHSTLPRAFLPPGLSYLGGYYGDDGHVYPTTASYVPCIEDPYARIADHGVQLGTWNTGVRSISPSPLDLSLKPPPGLSSSDARMEDCEAIEVDDDEDLRFSVKSQRRSLIAKRSYSNSEELSSGIVEDHRVELRRSSSVHDYHSYLDIVSLKDAVVDPRSSVQSAQSQRDVIVQSPTGRAYSSYEDVPTKKEIVDHSESSYRSHNSQDPSSTSCTLGELKNYQSLEDQQKILLGSPSHLATQSYHQQLLLTPQHHLQGINAPMTPPSTPSPPQCTRRRIREELDVTPSQTSSTVSSATPKQQSTSQSDKVSQRPKKKHARRLKFDEDTSSPVSGTVILGPDEAVVTGDIDPAFNIVEVTEEARAELAKIENRLGPYQCKLCRHLHDDAFQLAQHRCSRIAHVEYRCPECDKRFSCPANLASHRRWHKPRMPNGENGLNGLPATTNPSTTTARELEIACNRCDIKFTRAAALRKHLATQHPETNNNTSMANNNNNNNSSSSSNDNNSAFDDLNISISGKPICVPVSMHLGNASLTNEIP